jgi:hypothetical protein
MRTFITVREKINALKNTIREPFAWPGGYEKIAIMKDGELLCRKCVRKNFRQILRDTKEDGKSGLEFDSITLECEFESREWIEENIEEFSLDICARCNKVLNP